MTQTEKELRLAKGIVNGELQSDMCKEIGLTYGSTRNLACKPSVKALVAEMKATLIEKALPKAVKNLVKVIEQYDAPLDRDEFGKPFADGIQAREHGMAASIRVMEGAGLITGKNDKIYVQNIDNSVTIMPLITELIKNKLLGDAEEEEAIDV